jgi:hypothetical protein
MNERWEHTPLVAVEEVRCLDCGHPYAKPTTGGTAQANPGCPRCGYVGWLAGSVPVTVFARRRSGGGPLPHPSAQSG